ncbi:MAG: isoprenylcysteine carboxylmethyltransferase family protein [Thermomonas sp.]|uniref:methyltransferase family protein n=1 Tax=Thermomonas sp. TaxID=1971895 RepID=UPI0026226005|nr:isoprenylcysteine carboxylmethyltransferase family protein [Thermomonas sp.]MCC7096001.1 isoprenylcysteine carboxylmethyltransferase family protein [Thermomonas sp.]
MAPAWLYYGLITAWIAGELWLSLRRRAAASSNRQDQGSLKLLWWTIGASIFVGVFVSYFRLLPLPASVRPAVFLAGLGLIAAGLLLRWWSIRVLGRFFTVDVATCDDQHLVRSGPYRWLRHPSYTGALTSFTGLALCQGDGVSMALILVPILTVFLRRIRIEEHVLAQAFPEAYPIYARQTARLLPGLW